MSALAGLFLNAKDKAILSRIGNLRPVRDPTRPAHSTRAAHPLCTLCALSLCSLSALLPA